MKNDDDLTVRLEIRSLEIRKMVLIYRAVNHKLRQQFLKVLNAKKQMTVTEIYTQFKLEQSVTSQHLSVLRLAGLVKTTRNGKHVYYSVNYERLDNLTAAAKALVSF